MLEYLLLATFVTALAATTVWTIRAVQSLGRICYRAVMPGARGDKPGQAAASPTTAHLSRQLEDVRIPWGWRPRGRSRKRPVKQQKAPLAVSAAYVTPWGWPGYDNHGAAPAPDVARGAGLTGRGVGHGTVRAAGSFISTGDNEEVLLGTADGQTRARRPANAGKGDIREARSPWGW